MDDLAGVVEQIGLGGMHRGHQRVTIVGAGGVEEQAHGWLRRHARHRRITAHGAAGCRDGAAGGRAGCGEQPAGADRAAGDGGRPCEGRRYCHGVAELIVSRGAELLRGTSIDTGGSRSHRDGGKRLADGDAHRSGDG